MAFSDLMRVVVNTTFGLGGLIDMATPGGLDQSIRKIGVKPLVCGVFPPALMLFCHSLALAIGPRYLWYG